MTIPEIMQEIKRNYTAEIMSVITQPDNSGRGYVCPLCGSGTGAKGTGITAGTQNPHFFQCWACGFKGDVFDLLKAMTHKTDAVELIKEAERILHRQFLNDNKNMVENRKETPQTMGNDNKNMVKNTTVKDLLERAKAAEEKKAKAKAIADFIKAGQDAFEWAADAKEYLKRRGISEKTARRYNLGYVANYGDGMNTAAIIIPTGKTSYTARSIGDVDNGRKYRKKNAGDKQGIFNINALQNPGTAVFLVEGELDALSIIEAGFTAIATGGGTSEAELVNVIKETKTRPEYFIILPDNDRNPDGTPDLGENKGFSKGLKLANALKTANIPAKMIDTRNWIPAVKDCNDFLKTDRAGFISFLRGIEEPIKQEAMRNLGRASDFVQDFIDHISGKTAPINTGFDRVNELLDGGLHPGLIVIGAISSLGKTTFILNVADNMAAMGQDVIIFSLEMSKYELMAKSISRKTFEYCKTKKQPIKNAKTNLGISDFDRYQHYNNAELNMITECVQYYESNIAENIYLVEGVGDIGVEQIREHVRKFIAVTQRKPVIVIDYMQILAPADPRSTDKQNTDKAVVELKRISRDFNIPVIGISSFNRDSYSEPVSMKAFKESGAIEYTSDVLIGLQYTGMDYEMYTVVRNNGEEVRWETEKDSRRYQRIKDLFKENEVNAKAGDGISIDVKVLKNRSGAKGTQVLTYYPKFNCYREE